MAGIIEKGSNGLFSNEIEFRGKYATYARFLRDDVKIVQTFREAYVLGVIVGFMNNKTETDDNTPEVSSASIFPTELSKRKTDLRFIYRIIMLLKEEQGFSLDDYKNRAFRDDPEDDKETYNNNMKLFNSYACGGVEFLYEIFKNETEIDKVVDKLRAFLYKLSCDVGLLVDEELPEFKPDFGE